ncbi:unnamed protein product [Penicillium palitans]
MEEENELSEIISSYSKSSESEEQESISEHSEEDISETSEDRAFVVSDRGQSPYSDRSSETPNYSQHCHHRHNNDFSNPISCIVGHKIPISTIAKRVIHQNDSPVVQYLVLWRSWEQERPQ